MRKPREVALVIGNSIYSSLSATPGAQDATAFSEVLEEKGFDVTLKLNLKFKKMMKAIAIFLHSLQPRDTVVMYFSGHGCMVGGENYVVPVNGEKGEDSRRLCTGDSETERLFDATTYYVREGGSSRLCLRCRET
jgi:uncharacterized caspase-like protein